MHELLIKMLLSLGFSQAQISAVKAELEKEKPEEATLTTIGGEIKTTLTNLMMADPENVKAIRTEQYGKAMNQAEAYIKKTFALNADDVKPGEDGKEKTFEQIVDVAKAKSTETINKDKRELLEENTQLKNEVKDLKEVQLPAAKQGTEKAIQMFNLEQQFIKDITKVDAQNKPVRKLLIPVDSALPGIKTKLESMGLELRPAKEGSGLKYEIVNKETGLPMRNADGNKLLSNDDVIDLVTTELGYIAKSTPGKNEFEDVDTGKDKNDKDVKNTNLGYQEGNKHLQEIKQQLNKG